MTARLRTIGVLALQLAFAPAPAAEPSRAALEEAARLYREGAALFKEGRFREAADRFQGAYNIDPSPILLYNLARAAEEMGDAEAAIEHYEAYLARYPEAEDRAEVERRIRVLEAVRRQTRPGRLMLLGVPPGAAVTFNGAPAPVPDADGGWDLPPGRYQITVEAGDAPWERTVEVRSGEVLRLSWAGSTGPAEPSEGFALQQWAWVTLGAGVALGGGAVFFGLQAEAAEDDFHRLERAIAGGDRRPQTVERKRAAQDDARGNAVVANVLWGLAGAAAAAGATLFVLDLVDDGAPRTAVVPVPGGLGVVGTF